MTLTAGLLVYMYGTTIRPESQNQPPSLAAYVLAAVSLVALLVRHRAPRTGVAVTVACGVLGPPLGLFLSPLLLAPVMIAAYTIGTRPERRQTNVIMAVSSVLLAASSLLLEEGNWSEGGESGSVAFPLLACALARSLTDRRAYLAAVEERAQRAEESRESEARRRVAEERLRIARDLHDIVAHHITLANAQAQVAVHLFDSQPERARESLGKLSETTSDALDELRATVGVLRRTGDGESSTPMVPAPGLAELPELVASFERAGLSVAVHQEGTPRPLSPGADLTAYRVIQEALTNVTKHAATGAARVGLAYDRDRLTITVADDGRPADAESVPDHPHGGGYGLIGMRERVAAASGQMTAGRRPGGGFLVTSELPLPPRRVRSVDRGSAP
ncbi:sensor histidine kinase [Streptomyces sp. 6N223]|uniref:sensor histidine kinase n=1 Tax=Streptomyces sp. 6N223 TaxID=3457412 RepID=UPI003FD321EA